MSLLSRADSNGKLICPGTLHNGNGIVPIYSVYGFDSLGYITYRNGYPEGWFAIKSDLYLTQGPLTYKTDAVNYFPGKRVVFKNSNGDTDTETFSDPDFASLFEDSAHPSDLTLVSVTQDSVIENPRDFTYLSISYGFSDPAIIPTGTWSVTDWKTNKVLEIVVHDNNGNPIKVTKFSQKGEILWTDVFPPCNKRKVVKKDRDGALMDEYCPIR